MKLKIILIALILVTDVKAEALDTPQGLSPPLYLDPPSETVWDRKDRNDSDSSSGGSPGGSSCGACGS
jgi:hypothetical protein